MADASSGRNEFNAGSDSAKHHKGTATDQYKATPAQGAATPVTNRHPNGAVGVGTPPEADERSAAK